MKVLHIEIARMNWKGKTDSGVPFNQLLRVRQGDINGSHEVSGCTKADVMRNISDWIDSLYGRKPEGVKG